MNKIKFKDVKQAVCDEYLEIAGDEDDAETQEEAQRSGDEILACTDLDELRSVLDGLGFNGCDADDFIIGSIVEM